MNELDDVLCLLHLQTLIGSEYSSIYLNEISKLVKGGDHIKSAVEKIWNMREELKNLG